MLDSGVCPTTRLINMQVLERCLADGIISRVTRLSCEMDIPKKLFIDQDSASICGLDNVEFDLRGLQHLWRGSMGSSLRCVLSLDIINMGMWTVSSAVCKRPSMILGCSPRGTPPPPPAEAGQAN